MKPKDLPQIKKNDAPISFFTPILIGGVFFFLEQLIFIVMDNQEKQGRGRPRKTMEALVHRGKVPTTWKEDILDLGRRGKNKLHFANYLNISRDLMYRIMDRDADFSSTIKEALQLSEMWWVDKVSEAYEEDKSNKFNAQLWKYYMANVYRDAWKGEEQTIDITSKGEKINPDNNIIVEIVKPKTDENTETEEEQSPKTEG